MKKQLNGESKILAKEAEMSCLAALMQFPKKIPDISTWIKSENFLFSENANLYSLLLSTYSDLGSVDQATLNIKLRELGVTSFDGMDIFRYIELLNNYPVNEVCVEGYFKEVYKLFWMRGAYKKLSKGLDFISGSLEKDLGVVSSELEKMLVDALTISVDNEDIQFVDLYGTLEDTIRNRAESKDLPGFQTSFPVFNAWYGGLYFGDMYVFAAPAKRGKSAFINQIVLDIARNPANKVKVLYLDTELETERVQFRVASNITDINEFYFKDGSYKEDGANVKKVNRMFKDMESLHGIVHHVYVENRPIEEIVSIIRRWYSKNVKKGENCLIAYDYIKLATETVSEFWKEYQVIGQKTDTLKKLGAKLPNTVVLTSIQTNANCDIAMSQQLKWFASNVYILQPKDILEFNDHGPNFGTHKLVEVVARNQGREAKGMNNLIKVTDNKGKSEHKQNFINFKFHKFRFSECGTLEDILTQRAGQLEPEKGAIDHDRF